MIKVAIFSIGEELLEGSVVDTNSAFIGGKLAEIGLAPRMIKTLPDDADTIIEAVRSTAAEYQVIITTGGLGPTFDDLTISSIAGAFGLPLVKDEAAAQHIVNRLSSFNIQVNDAQMHQAFFPEGAEVLPNPNGTACAMRLEAGGCVIFSMPGVPHEMKWILTEQIIPWLEKRFKLKNIYRSDLYFVNLSESSADSVIRKMGVPQDVRCIINVSDGTVVVKLRADTPEKIAPLAEKLKTELKDNYAGDDPRGIAHIAVELLKAGKLTLAVAESCTGGLLGGEITRIAGVSEVFYGGVISYDNSVKINTLGVPSEVISSAGAVSEECALAMAAGVKTIMNTSCSISVTGIAGPDGGSADKPVGTVYIAVMVHDITVCKRFALRGDRDVIRRRAVAAALGLLISALNKR